MNIFYLHHHPQLAAMSHCDKHVVKMILESAQILSAVHHRFGSVVPSMYKATHTKHPSTLWAGDSETHYNWLWQMAMCLCQEYTKRYGKVHKTQPVLEALKNPPNGMSTLPFLQPPQCMPDECKVPGNTVKAYQNYYNKHKAYMAKWNYSNPPAWFEAIQEELV